MCTVIKLEDKDKPLIAKRDIKVYKIGKKGMRDKSNFISPFQRYIYMPNILETIEEFKFDELECASDSIEVAYKNTISSDELIYVTSGFHSFATLKRTRTSDLVDWNKDERITGFFIIPKGSLYYKNGCNNIVSNQIIFKHFI